MSKTLLSILAITSLFVTACNHYDSDEMEHVDVEYIDSPIIEEEMDLPETSGHNLVMDEVALHNSAADCWLVVNGNVYDVTEFVPSHQGGEAILKGCGLDATEMFESQHPEEAKATLENYLLGPLE